MADGEVSTIEDLLSGEIPDETAPLPSGAPPIAFQAAPAQLGFAGGVLGAQFGGPVAPARGLGAAVGGTAGHFIGQSIQDLANNVPVSLDRIAQNMVEATKTGLIQGSAEMALPVAGQFVSAAGGKRVAEFAVGKVAKKLGEYVLPATGTVVQKAEKMAAKGGGELTPGQMIEPGLAETGRGVRLAENLAYNAWFGGPLKGTYQMNEQAVNRAFDGFVTQMEKLAPKDAEEVFRDVVTGRLMNYMMRPADVMFDNIRKRAPGGQVELTPLIKQLRDPNSALGNLVIGGLRKVRDSIKDPTKLDQFDKLIDLFQTPKPGTIGRALPKLTLDQAIHLRTELNNIAKRPSFSASPEGQMLVNSAEAMSKRIDDAVMAALRRQEQLSSDTTLVRDYEKARKFYAAATEKYRNEFVKKTLDTIEKKPGSLARLLMPNSIPSEAEHLELIRGVKSAYGPRWNLEIRPMLAGTLGRRAFDEVNGTFSGKKLVAELDKYGRTLLDEMLGKGTAQEMVDAAKVLEHVAQRPKGMGSVAIQLMTAGAAAGVAGATGYAITGDLEGAGKAAGAGTAAILLGPKLLGHILGDPRWLKAMKTGVMQFSKTGKPPGLLLTTLRQAAATVARPTLEESLTLEPDLPKKLATFGAFARGPEKTLQEEK